MCTLPSCTENHERLFTPTHTPRRLPLWEDDVQHTRVFSFPTHVGSYGRFSASSSATGNRPIHPLIHPRREPQMFSHTYTDLARLTDSRTTSQTHVLHLLFPRTGTFSHTHTHLTVKPDNRGRSTHTNVSSLSDRGIHELFSMLHISPWRSS